jgi:hypothetical protein
MKKLNPFFVPVMYLVFTVLLSLLACGPAQYILRTTVIPQGAGTITPAGGRYDPGTELTINAMPASGYAFDYWSGDFTGTTTSSTVIVTMNKDKNITAYFKPGYKLTVSVSPSGGGTVSSAGSAYGVGDKVCLDVKAALGYEFDQWSGDADGYATHYCIVMDGNKNIIANFKESSPRLVILSHQAVKTETKTGYCIMIEGTAKNVSNTNIDNYIIRVKWYDISNDFIFESEYPARTRTGPYQSFSFGVAEYDPRIKHYEISIEAH